MPGARRRLWANVRHDRAALPPDINYKKSATTFTGTTVPVNKSSKQDKGNTMTSKVQSVDTAVAINFAPIVPERLLVAVDGTVATSGWSSPRLAPYYYLTPPTDGIWDFDFVADEPTGF